ncbi:MAG: hypothetical protein CO156_00285 [Candidatus Pacebacteria bacterium CG_4_9_14_3_um_filter_40_12]|nr:MAG: hypothetical protein COU64_01020 [Candidatus Pacebacteria bacterium CG10_big_fil_rev_8_21_14_0_10_40_26]PIZ78463.1 MAG: hypothetical protein COY01_04400 [Candidatus Pacebacteria bacterium CG_4_10_14_0_2_um_filter_40_20]PJA69313.1 MAG: hypothetical protein CO156_00285 [Candidatus Pacebacteria bacterium CG_4_9_14_3_um_filter_40_12]PJC41996.1 MAG: hypothetical protein CO041_01840 [Candidatus Pacebacteria bacterium CG_4_9_14_0_2_um_filter_40_15]
MLFIKSIFGLFTLLAMGAILLFYRVTLQHIDGNYYKGLFDTVYYQSDFEGAKFYTKLKNVKGKDFRVVNNNCPAYCLATNSNQVIYKAYIIEGSDTDSFEFIDYWYAKDKKSVYYLDDARTKEIQGADPKTFHSVGRAIYQDKNNYYKFGEITEYK